MTRWLILLAACGVALPVFAQKSPEETVKSMTVAPGLQVELFAAEPMLVNPTSIDIDHRGRVWVCEAVNYRRVNFGRPILRPEGDRIVILEDTDGDGKADKSTVFYQGKDLIAPIGIAVAAYPAAYPAPPANAGGSPDEPKGSPLKPKGSSDKPKGSLDKPGGSSDKAKPLGEQASLPRKRGEAPPKSPRFAYKVFVCQSPDILVFEDKDGDGKADGPPKKFLSGFRGFDHDHGVHGINIGPDGKLYFTVGDQGVQNLQSSDGKGRKFTSNNTDCRAGTVWRCDMDGKNLELIAHNFRNNYECCVNSFGEIWLSDNDDDGNQQTRICYVMPGGNYGYNPRGPGQSHWHEEQPGIVHKVLRTGFGSPTGICFYEGTLLPEKYRGQLLHTDAGPREFRCFHIKPKGAGYELEKENLVTSTDTWFRLSDVCVAPDGSVMLADWYDPGVGGHGMGDWTRGRIYRVTPKGHKGYKVPAVELASQAGLIATLRSPCLATRGVALADFAARPPKEVLGAAFAALENNDRVTQARAHWAMASRVPRIPAEDRAPDALAKYDQFLRSRETDPEFLAMFMRSIPESENSKFNPDDDPTVMEAASKAFARFPASVRRELLMLTRRMPARTAGRMFYPLAKLFEGEDIFYRAALNIACGTDPKRREAILAEFDKHFPDWNDKVADLVWELRPASSLPRLGKLLEDPKLTAAQKGRIVDILAVYDTADAGKTMLALLHRDLPAEIKSRAIENLRIYLPTKWKNLQKSDEIRETMARLLKSKDLQIAGLHLAAAAPDCVNQSDLEAIATDTKANRETRIEAVRVIGKIHHVKYFHQLEAMINDPVVGTAAVLAIGDYVGGRGVNSGGKQAMELLQRLITSNMTTDDLRQAALNALVGTRQGTGMLLQMKEQDKMPKTILADAGRLLRNSPFAGERNKALLLFPAPGKLDPKKLPAPAVLAKRIGNAVRGEAIFKATAKSEAQCLRCHSVRGVGGNIGPDLSMIGKKASKENLYDSILTPSKAIADQYLQWKINTLDGKSVIGLLVAENDKEITLRDANGKDYTFAQKDLDGPKQKSLVSIMPDNLVAALTEGDLIDVVEYLFTLKTPALTPDSWYVMGPFKRGGDDPLSHNFGPEKATFDAKATFPEWNGPSSGPKPRDLSWRTIHPDAKGYIDLMALHGNAGNNSVSFLYRAIVSPVEQTGEFLIGSDDGCVLFVNGKEVLHENVTRAAAPEQNRVKVKLKAGKNEVLMKIANGNNPHGAYVTILSEQELKVK